jgi:hypothetical protein
LKHCDYIVNKWKIINENDNTEAFRFKWNDELIWRSRIIGGDPRGYNDDSDEDSDDKEEEQDN